MKYRVWDPMDRSKDLSSLIEADSFEEAAEKYVEAIEQNDRPNYEISVFEEDDPAQNVTVISVFVDWDRIITGYRQ